MVDRRKPEPTRIRSPLDSFRKDLAIDRDQLDDCIVEHVELFDGVGQEHVEAAAHRDALQLKLNELLVAIEGEIREEIAGDEEAAIKREEKYKKPTEDSIRNRIAADDRVRKLTRELQEAKTDVARWAALRESFKERSEMLTNLAKLKVSRASMSSSIGAARNDIADRRMQEIQELRQKRRGDKA